MADPKGLDPCLESAKQAMQQGGVGNSFFFSSRRRHTSWPRDWSSDVCSSDLDLAGRAASQPSSWRAKDLRDIGEEDRRECPRDCRRWAPRRHSISSTRLAQAIKPRGLALYAV